VLERLPEDYRQVIVLRNLQELPYEEIAERMNRTSGAVRMLWVRALAQLRDAISPTTDTQRQP
jgi:RNA polymerase sigma-70 factor (ECF subfamily)